MRSRETLSLSAVKGFKGLSLACFRYAFAQSFGKLNGYQKSRNSFLAIIRVMSHSEACSRFPSKLR